MAGLLSLLACFLCLPLAQCLESTASDHVSLLQTQAVMHIPQEEPRRTKKVAFALVLYKVFLADDGNLRNAMELSVLAASVRRASLNSSYDTSLVALVRRKIVDSCRAPLEGLGFEVVPVDMPIPVEEIGGNLHGFALSDELHHGQHAEETTMVVDENDKLLIYSMTQYDRVVLVDTDVLVLDAIDELLDAPEETLGILDYYGQADSKMSVTPPMNAGFLVVRPSDGTWKKITDMIRRGNFSGGFTADQEYTAGWEGLGVGYVYDGSSIQGLLPAMYFREAIENRGTKTRAEAVRGALDSPNRQFRELDQCVYNVLGHKNCWGGGFDLPQGTPDCKNIDCSSEANPTLEYVQEHMKVIHFTGTCIEARPWDNCKLSRKERPFIVELCEEFQRRWVQTATQLLKEDSSVDHQRWAPGLSACTKEIAEAPRVTEMNEAQNRARQG